MSDRETALFANMTFYAAFAARDMPALERLWGDGDVMCVHPGWPPLVGHEAVMASWRNILGGQDPPEISCRKAVASIHGTTAVVTCMESHHQSRPSAASACVRPTSSSGPPGPRTGA